MSEVAVFGGGCFWCIEAIFERIRGVEEVTSGYMGGQRSNPSYELITSGRTGHAEVLQIKFDPNMISYEVLLEIFWHAHDPTTLNQQGADHGTQYRSAIFTTTITQQEQAERSKQQLEESHEYPQPIVTQITKATEFFPAEKYLTHFYDTYKGSAYCSIVIEPKLQKILHRYAANIKQSVLS